MRLGLRNPISPALPRTTLPAKLAIRAPIMTTTSATTRLGMKSTIELIRLVTAVRCMASAASSMKIRRMNHLTSSARTSEALASLAPVRWMKPVTPVRWATVSNPIRRSKVPTTRATRSARNQPMISRMMAPTRAGRKDRTATSAAVMETSTASPKLVICGMALRVSLESAAGERRSRNLATDSTI